MPYKHVKICWLPHGVYSLALDKAVEGKGLHITWVPGEKETMGNEIAVEIMKSAKHFAREPILDAQKSLAIKYRI